jgi:SAM-dependent methyltransferase
MALNRARLARFLAEFADDSDVRDLLLLDLLGVALDAPMSSTGTVVGIPPLAERPFRLWEYAWLYKGLGLDAGGLDVLDLGGPASHLVILSALAGNRVVSLDINPAIVSTARDCAASLNLDSLTPRLGDMRTLPGIRPESFDVIVCCSVLEHLTAEDQARSLRMMSRALRPGGRIGLTFDYGPPAPGANQYLPPPHEPPESAAEVSARYQQDGLTALGNAMSDEPLPGSLFHDKVVKYTMGSLFLGKAPLAVIDVPRPQTRKLSPFSSLATGQLPYRLHRHTKELEARFRESAETERRLRADLDSMRGVAAERLKALHAATTEVARLRAEPGRPVPLPPAAAGWRTARPFRRKAAAPDPWGQ